MSPAITQLPIPGHFDPGKVGEIRALPYLELEKAAAAWAKEHGITPAATDNVRVSLMVIDAQNTFCIPGFELPVNGAVEDNIRLCEFAYRHLGVLTEISATMDTHRTFQVFHRRFWINEKGEHPEPFATIPAADVEEGRWQVNPAMVANIPGANLASLQRLALHYVRELKAGGRYDLTIWPYHAMLGGIGHALVPAVEELCFFHSIARSVQTQFEIKGGHVLTENYSVLGPEVLTQPDGSPLAQKNTHFIERLLGFGVVIIAGQAKSHCVAWTIDDLLTEIMAQDPALARKVYLLEDCTSPIVTPDVDLTDKANEAFARFAAAGMHVVRTTTPIQEWPGIPL